MENKRKVRSDSKKRPNKRSGTKSLSLTRDSSTKFNRKKRRTGPRLPSSFRKELNRINPYQQFNTVPEEDDDEIKSADDANDDLYEYEEAVAEEESKKNRRYDHVENYEYELPEEFEDEVVVSDDEEDEYDGNETVGTKVSKGKSDLLDDDYDGEEEDDERHSRMLQEITGMPTEAFKGKKKNVVISELYPESEYNPTRDVLDGGAQITIDDLLEDLAGKKGYSEVRKNVHRMQKKATPLHVPLSKDVHDKLDRKAAYDQSKKLITKWEPLIKRNREAPTIIFEKDTNLGFSTVGAIASEFEPRTEFEKKIASLVYDDKVMEAHKEDGARLLEFNKIPVEDYVKYQNHIAKMRGLLFRHEVKMKRIKKIKSKTYHRLLKKDRLKSATSEILTNKEAAKELEMKQEFRRAEERMTLRHKNTTKWSKRILERGLSVQDEGTRAAMAEQLNQHALLTKKMNSMKHGSSSDDSDDEDDDESMAGSDQDMQSNLLEKAKEKTLKVAEDEDEEPKSGVFSLPFMVRADKKRKEVAIEEAKLALQDYESSLKQLEDTDGAESTKMGIGSGRRVFGASKKQVIEEKDKIKPNSNSSDSEDEAVSEQDVDNGFGRANDVQKDVSIKSSLLHNDSNAPHDSLFKTSDIAGCTVPKTTYEVGMLVSDTWKKMSSQNEVHTKNRMPPKFPEPVSQNQDIEEVGEESDADSDAQMVDGILASDHRSSYELPSQAELIREAFAGDDVEAEFDKDKEDIMNEENPEPEKPALLPGWGQWTHVQRKKGLPSWMLEEHEIAKRKREEALKKRKDAHLKHVIISEKLDKKAEKLHLKTLPHTFKSNELFEQSIRNPVGPEFNPETAVRALNRPEVVKKPGSIINPIKYEDVDPYEKKENHKRGGSKQKPKQKQKMSSSQSRIKAVVAKS